MSSRTPPRQSVSLKRQASSTSMDSGGDAFEVPEGDDQVNEMYAQILDHMLTAPAMKEQLMESQSMEKKRQFVKMHSQLFKGGWGDAETMLLSVIQKARVPDIHSLSTLKIGLKSANKEFMSSFLEAGGVAVLLKATENRINKNPVTELDIAILYEIMSCCKAVMNNSTGMDGILSVPGAIDTIARSLNFEYKLYALLVLEILSVCCYYTEKAASQVVEGMRHLARSQREAPFACLSLALLQQDIEVKASAVQFVNSMVMGVADLNARSLLRNDLNAQLFGERYDEAAALIEAELKVLAEVSDSDSAKSPQSKLRRRSMVTLHGTRAYNDKKVDAMLRSTAVLAAISEEGSILGSAVEVKSNNQSVFVSPLQGSMAGLLMAAKNAEKLESKFLDVFGGKKTKRRWYELDKEAFRWCAGHEKDSDYKGSVPVSTITDIRPYSNDRSIADSSPHAFEFETTERTYAFGCETAAEKDSWVTALETSRDDYIMTRGAYKVQFRELTTADVAAFSEMYRKQGQVFHSICAEDKRALLAANGLDTADSVAVGRFLQCEALAAGSGSKLLAVLQELLVVPAGADGTWDAIHAGIRRLREASGRDARAGTAAFSESLQQSMVQQLNAKAADGGAAYGQVSKLALSTLASEQELQRQCVRVKDLEGQLERLLKERGEVEANIARLTNEQAAASLATPAGPPAKAPKPTPGSDPAAAVTATATVVSLAPSAAVDPRFEKYCKMRKMLPEGAVRQKMATDGFGETEIEQFFSGTLPPPATAAATTTESAAAAPVAVAVADERFAKYDKMRKMLPEGAVRQKMATDDFTPEQIEQYFSGELPAAAPAAAPSAAPAAAVDERYAKYDKMRKMLPEGAVRQKMMGDGFSPTEIEKFFSGEVTTATAAPAPAAVDPRFGKYDKMRKMLPEGAVRQKMTGDGFTPAEIDKFFSGEIMTATAAPPPAPAAVDPRYEKYDKMRKMLPEGAVRQKMTGDGFTPAEIDKFMSGAVMTVAAAAPAAPVPLDPRFEKYDKMRKMLPEGAVRQKMAQEGFTPAEVESFFNPGAAPSAASAPKVAAKPAVVLPVIELPPEGMSAKPKIVPSVKLKGVFWSKLKPGEVPGTVWHRLNEHKLSKADTARLEEWFAAKVAEPTPAEKAAAQAKAALAALQPKAVSILDGKRTQNVLLVIGKIRREPEGLIKLIIDLDPAELTQELTNMLFAILPTAEELAAVKAYSSPSQLDAASKVLFQFNRVPRLLQRMECHDIAFSWFTNANALATQFSVVQTACAELARSQRQMEALLGMILSIGNYINGDTARGQAYGVRLDIFMKLSNLKAALPSQGSLMHFLALVAEAQSHDLVTLGAQWTGISAAAEVSLKQITTDFNQLDAQVNKMNAEFIRLKDTMDNVGLDGQLEDCKGFCTNPLHRRLDKFLREAKPRVLAIKEQAKSAEGAAEAVMARYGESLKALSEEDPCKKFFSTVATFAAQLGATHDDNRAAREAAEKAAKQLAEGEAKRAGGGAEEKKGVPSAPATPKKGPTDNIFGKFHSSQAASSDDVLEEFKRKMLARQQKG